MSYPSRVGIDLTRPRHVGASGFASASLMNRARVSGRGNANTRRDAGSGSNTLVKTVSEPLASNRNGSRSPAITAPSRISAGTPSAYRAVCH
ncbi:unannotated protein [freshwater metagenome]|uniref:Unannotated protein n=1 Tax=freshwater metagenome TaxID=449393 RepID=A0A6J7LT10_9ZZZZ